MYLNKVFIYGNLTRDPEMRALPSGGQVANFGIATNRVYKDKEGNKKEQVEFHTIVAFGRQADLIGQYMKKGRGLFIEGRLQTRSWEDKQSGEKKYRTEIIVENFQFGPGGERGGTPGGGASRGDDFSEPAPKKGGDADAIQYPDEEINPEDIPF